MSLDPPETIPGPTNVRYQVLLALALAAVLSYLLRASVATAGTTIQRELALGDVTMGYILGMFFIGYTWFQIPAGWLGDRLGARVSLSGMGLLWAACMVSTALANSSGILAWSRLGLGITQAGLFAVTIKALADWFPETRRGLTGAVITASMSVGAVVASALTARLIAPLGWRATLLGYGGITVAWALFMAVWFRNRPTRHPAVNGAELALIQAKPALDGGRAVARSALECSTAEALAGMARSFSMWALCVTSFFRSFGYALFITWFPAYLEKGHGVSVAGSGDLTVMPLVGVVLGCFTGGWVVDGVLERTGNKWLSRSGVGASSLALCALATLAAILARQPLAAVAVISVGSFFSGLAAPSTWAATADLTSGHEAIGFAVMNMAGNLGAIACPIVLGYLFDYLTRSGGNWDLVLYLFAGVYLAGSACWLVLDPSRSAVTPAPPLE